MNPSEILRLDDRTRQALWQRMIEAIETYLTGVPEARVAPELDPQKVRSILAPLDFSQPLPSIEALDFAAQNLWQHQVHTPHPRYFGLFNPASTSMGIAADAFVAAFNPQLAAWSHNPFADEVEAHLVRTFASRFGYDPANADGTFTTGGAEANHTALLTALVHTFPGFARLGLRSLDAQPTLYVSTQSHHSFIKAARACGLGTDAVRQVPVDENLQMDVPFLSQQIAQDKAAGFAPFFVVATAGSTNAGVVDPIPTIASLAAQEKLWFHADAAWGGAAIFVPELRPVLEGIQQADSITFDAHKWLSAPMSAGIYLTRHPHILGETFRITTNYMPTDASGLNVVDPYTHSIQWSRRFIGLKVFLSLLVAGWEGYITVIRHQTAMGDLLRQQLTAAGWEIVNQTPLPVVCFVDGANSKGRTAPYIEGVARQVVASGDAWLSSTRLYRDQPVLRACITNFSTTPEDVSALIQSLEEARRKVLQGI